MSLRSKILLLMPHLGGGGAEQVMRLLAGGLSRQKFELHLGLVTESLQDVEKHRQGGEIPAGVEVHALGARRVRSGAVALLRLVWRVRPVAILAGIAHLNFLVLLLKPFFPRGTRVLVRQNSTVSRSLAVDRLPFYTRFFYRLLYRRADQIICQSSAMADDLATVAGLQRAAIAVLPNPLDFEGIHGALGSPSRWRGEGPNLLAVGRLSPEKGFDLLLEAVALLGEEFPGLQLTILGAGALEGALKSQRQALGLEKSVVLAGYQKRPYLYYPGATLFVLSSRHEGMPNALLEALVGELPVVATPASGGVVALLSGRARCWLAQEASAEALSEALRQALRALEASGAQQSAAEDGRTLATSSF